MEATSSADVVGASPTPTSCRLRQSLQAMVCEADTIPRSNPPETSVSSPQLSQVNRYKEPITFLHLGQMRLGCSLKASRFLRFRPPGIGGIHAFLFSFFFLRFSFGLSTAFFRCSLFPLSFFPLSPISVSPCLKTTCTRMSRIYSSHPTARSWLGSRDYSPIISTKCHVRYPRRVEPRGIIGSATIQSAPGNESWDEYTDRKPSFRMLCGSINLLLDTGKRKRTSWIFKLSQPSSCGARSLMAAS